MFDRYNIVNEFDVKRTFASADGKQNKVIEVERGT